MAKEKQVKESVVLTSPKGVRVTVSKDSQEKYTDRGYRAETRAKKAGADASSRS